LVLFGCTAAAAVPLFAQVGWLVCVMWLVDWMWEVV
jgi:hypothetical protein